MVWFISGSAIASPIMVQNNISYHKKVDNKDGIKFKLRELPSSVERLIRCFKETVKTGLVPDKNYVEFLRKEVLSAFARVGKPVRGQYFVFADRNPSNQIAVIGYFEPATQSVYVIGVDRVSTGNKKKKGFFETPIGIFTKDLNNFDYRALGTKNSKGWRGLGNKDARVWDFGWQLTSKCSQGKYREFKIRMLMHATDPEFGEKRLGKPDSKGCVRISNKLNRFIDHYGLLDYEYENNLENKKVRWFLKNDRKPVPEAGQYLIIGDSSP